MILIYTTKQYFVVTCKHLWQRVAAEDPEMYKVYERRLHEFNRAPESA